MEDKISKLERLVELKNAGALTEEEFQQQKSELLNDGSANQITPQNSSSVISDLSDLDAVAVVESDKKYLIRFIIFWAIISFFIGIGTDRVGAGFLAFIGCMVYFVPTFVAYIRGHNNRLAIHWTNVFLGWTFLGWVITLIWACTNNVKR